MAHTLKRNHQFVTLDKIAANNKNSFCHSLYPVLI